MSEASQISKQKRDRNASAMRLNRGVIVCVKEWQIEYRTPVAWRIMMPGGNLIDVNIDTLAFRHTAPGGEVMDQMRMRDAFQLMDRLDEIAKTEQGK